MDAYKPSSARLTFPVRHAPIATVKMMGASWETVPVLSVLKHTCLYFALGFTAGLIEGIVEQPHPAYLEPGVSWFSLTIQGSLFLGALLAVPMGIVMFLNTLGGTNRDTQYHPQLKGLAGLWRQMDSRWTLILGGILILVYWGFTTISYIHEQSFPVGLIWPPDRIVVTILFSWAVLWRADVLRRPSRQTLLSCNAFMVFTLFFVLMFGFGFTRE